MGGVIPENDEDLEACPCRSDIGVISPVLDGIIHLDLFACSMACT